MIQNTIMRLEFHCKGIPLNLWEKHQLHPHLNAWANVLLSNVFANIEAQYSLPIIVGYMLYYIKTKTPFNFAYFIARRLSGLHYNNKALPYARAELNKSSRDADLLKGKSGLESPPEFRRSWHVEGHIRVYEGNKDPKDHLGIFSAAAEQKEWMMPIWCKMFRQTLELAKKLNDKIPKTVDKMFERVRVFIRGEVAAGSAKMVRPSQGDNGYVRPAWFGVPEKARSIGGLREARRNMGVYTPYPRKKYFHPAYQDSERDPRHGKYEPIILEGIIEGNQVRRILVDGGSSSEIIYEHYFRNLDINIRSRLRRCKAPMIGFSRETYHPLGLISLRVTMGKEGRSKTVLMEFEIIKCYSPYNIIIGRTGMRSLRAVSSTIHSMIKFPTDQGVVTIETSRETLRECKHLERVQGSWPSSGLVSLEETRSKEDIEEVFTISHELPDQYVMMGATLITNCK
ncbi:reverse transcriptase domain-containing protein [Tanacetum coccineum]